MCQPKEPPHSRPHPLRIQPPRHLSPLRTILKDPQLQNYTQDSGTLSAAPSANPSPFSPFPLPSPAFLSTGTDAMNLLMNLLTLLSISAGILRNINQDRRCRRVPRQRWRWQGDMPGARSSHCFALLFQSIGISVTTVVLRSSVKALPTSTHTRSVMSSGSLVPAHPAETPHARPFLLTCMLSYLDPLDSVLHVAKPQPCLHATFCLLCGCN